jgi:hypothetical protein
LEHGFREFCLFRCAICTVFAQKRAQNVRGCALSASVVSNNCARRYGCSSKLCATFNKTNGANCSVFWRKMSSESDENPPQRSAVHLGQFGRNGDILVDALASIG